MPKSKHKTLVRKAAERLLAKASTNTVKKKAQELLAKKAAKAERKAAKELNLRQTLPRANPELSKAQRAAMRELRASGTPVADSSAALAAAFALRRGAPTPDEIFILDSALAVAANASESLSVIVADLRNRARKIQAAMQDPARSLARNIGNHLDSLDRAAKRHVLRDGPEKADEHIAALIRHSYQEIDGIVQWQKKSVGRSLAAIGRIFDGSRLFGPLATAEIERIFTNSDWGCFDPKSRKAIARLLFLDLFENPQKVLATRLKMLRHISSNCDSLYDDAANAFADAWESGSCNFAAMEAEPGSGARSDPWYAYLALDLSRMEEKTVERMVKVAAQFPSPPTEAFFHRCISCAESSDLLRRAIIALSNTPNVFEWRSPVGHGIAEMINIAIHHNLRSGSDLDAENLSRLFSALVDHGMDPESIVSSATPLKVARHGAVSSAIERRELGAQAASLVQEAIAKPRANRL